MRRIVLVTASIVLLLAIILGYWLLARPDASSQLDLGGEVVVVSRGPLNKELVAGGNVALERKAPLRFKMAGRIQNLLVAEGDRVSAGDKLACLEMFDIQKGLLRTEAELSRADAQLAKLEAGPREQEIASAEAAVAIAEANLRAAEAVVDSAEAALVSAKAAHEGSQAALAKMIAGPTDVSIAIAERRLEQARNDLWAQQAQRDAMGSSVYGDADREAAEGRVASSETQVEIARLQLEELETGARPEDVAASRAQVAQALAAIQSAEASLAQARAQVDVAEAQLLQSEAQLSLLKAGSRQEDLDATEAQVRQAKATLEESQLQIDEACLIAPFAGLVAKVDAQISDLVEPNQSVITVVDDSCYHVIIRVDEADIGKVAVGQPVDLSIDAYLESQASGEIVYISPLAESDSGIVSYEVRVDIVACDVPLREGLTVDATVVTESYQDVLMVPNSAVIVDEETGDRYVARQTDSGTELVRIVTGVYNDSYSQVLSGLEEGDMVLRRSTSYREHFREMMTGTFPGS